MKKFYLILLALLALFTTAATAQSTVGNKYQVNGLYYRVTSLSPNEVIVVSEHDPGVYNAPQWTSANQPEGDIVIPQTITSPHSEIFTVTAIELGTFLACDDITSITLPETLRSIGEFAFYGCSGITTMVIPESVTNIEQFAFSACFNITSITLSSNLTAIENGLFANCEELVSIVIPENVTSIGAQAFQQCYKLKNITLPKSLTTIKMLAFVACDRLTSIILPENITTIESAAFGNCMNLANIECQVADPNDITLAGTEQFLNVGNNVPGGTTLYVPVGSKTLYENADEWQNFNIEEGSIGTHPISKSQIQLAVSGGTLSLANLPTNQVVKIYSLTGELMHQVAANNNHNPQITLPQGTYIVQVGQYTDKVIIK